MAKKTHVDMLGVFTDMPEETAKFLRPFLEFMDEMSADFSKSNYILFTHIKFEHLIRQKICKCLKVNVNDKLDDTLIIETKTLPTFISVINMAFVLNIISKKEHSWLKKMNKIRNKVAHHPGYAPSEQELDELNQIIDRERNKEMTPANKFKALATGYYMSIRDMRV
tara:strand:+ start:434 stop:934 length:501 start_codon:yes stop_codon:yes gene_type:complete